MTARPKRAQPMRRWLALALASVFVIPLCVTALFAIVWVGEEPHDPRAEAVAAVRSDSNRWDDPVWQVQTAAELSQHNVDIVLVEGDREIFRSDSDPVSGDETEGGTRIVQKVVIPGTDPLRVAYVYVPQQTGPPEEVPVEILPFVLLATLALTLGGIAWFLGRTVLRPLAATSEAAREVAKGNLDVALPASRVREVAEVNSAFEAMSEDLRASLRQQAAMEEERRLFVGSIAHDLRTPLFSLRGYLEGLKTGLADTDEKKQNYLSIAQQKADALEYLISDLFDFTRLEYLDQSPDRTRFAVGELLRRVVEGVGLRASEKEIAIRTELDEQPMVLNADERLVTRVVENLVDNALRHTPVGGEIIVRCCMRDDDVEFSVEDSGPGIPEEDLPHLFTPLFRGEESRNRQTGGAGLGLTIARRIVEAHGGSLVAGNRAEGGAKFTVVLPTREPVSR